MSAGVIYNEHASSAENGFKILTSEVSYIFNEVADYDFPDDRVINLLAEPIECETLATWLLVSWLEESA